MISLWIYLKLVRKMCFFVVVLEYLSRQRNTPLFIALFGKVILKKKLSPMLESQYENPWQYVTLVKVFLNGVSE